MSFLGIGVCSSPNLQRGESRSRARDRSLTAHRRARRSDAKERQRRCQPTALYGAANDTWPVGHGSTVRFHPGPHGTTLTGLHNAIHIVYVSCPGAVIAPVISSQAYETRTMLADCRHPPGADQTIMIRGGRYTAIGQQRRGAVRANSRGCGHTSRCQQTDPRCVPSLSATRRWRKRMRSSPSSTNRC